jgi:hypothetical protein
MTTDSQTPAQAAAIGFAVRVCAPSLLHAIRGSLHDVTMLAALLEPPAADGATPGSAAAKAAQRVHSIRAELKALEHEITLLGGVMTWPRRQAEAVCATAAALPQVVRLLNDEAARRRIKLQADIDALPAYIAADESALQRALLTCGAWIAQNVGEGTLLRLSAREQGDEAVFEFDPASGALPVAPSDEHPFLEALVAAAGGTLSTAPTFRLAFRCASPRDARLA